jgi:hypothetical protein
MTKTHWTILQVVSGFLAGWFLAEWFKHAASVFVFMVPLAISIISSEMALRGEQ